MLETVPNLYAVIFVIVFMAPTNQVLVKEDSNVRFIILNRPKQLNALSLEMVMRLLELFPAYEDDPKVKLIIMKGEGRAFCAGADIVSVYHESVKGNWKRGVNFFLKEYTLDYLMATCTKPQVSLLEGIVMGGGAGLAMHGRFRVATDTTVFAMPDAALGIFPDVGASYFLSRLPGFFGEYMGLTGARLDGAEMLACGLATHFVPLEKLSLLEDALCKANTGDPKIISRILSEFSNTPKLKEQSQNHRFETIDKCFSKRTIEEIICALEKEADKNTDDWIAWTIQSLKKASPISLKVFLRSIREGRLEGVGQCLIREYRMMCAVTRGEFSKDAFEGIREVLIHKSKNPKWEPSKLELVSVSMVDHYFEASDDKDHEDLKLPPTTNLTSHAISKL